MGGHTVGVEPRIHRWLLVLRRFLLLFLGVAFVITCSMLLFLNTMMDALGITLGPESITHAARLTFVNVVLLSLLFTVIEELRQRFAVERPIRQITRAAERIAQGDFSARVDEVGGLWNTGEFNAIADSFNRMAEELSGTESLRNDFIANVSHEFKTPLSVIQSYGTMLKQPNLPETQRREYAAAIVEASGRLTDLVTNILKLNKLENQQMFPAARPYDLGEQLCACLLGFERAWEDKELDIDVDVEPGVMVNADEELLSLVWNNLLSNAIKFTEPHGTVSLSMHAEGDSVQVRVSDTGCGIDPEAGRHIFEKFYQGDASHATQGNGLGLALVKRVIDIVGGDVSVSSKVGVGSTFTVTLRRQ